MKKVFLKSALAIFLIAVTSSFIFQKEVVKATSDWTSSQRDAESDCKAKLEANDGDTKKEVRYYDREESQDEMKKPIYKTSCSCYKKEKK